MMYLYRFDSWFRAATSDDPFWTRSTLSTERSVL